MTPDMLTKTGRLCHPFLEGRNARHDDSVTARIPLTVLGADGKKNDVDGGKKNQAESRQQSF
jgi:hypothetical protein